MDIKTIQSLKRCVPVVTDAMLVSFRDGYTPKVSIKIQRALNFICHLFNKKRADFSALFGVCFMIGLFGQNSHFVIEDFHGSALHFKTMFLSGAILNTDNALF